MQPVAQCSLTSGDCRALCPRVERALERACRWASAWVGPGRTGDCRTAAALFLCLAGERLRRRVAEAGCAYCLAAVRRHVWRDVLRPEIDQARRLPLASLDALATPEGAPIEIADPDALPVEEQAARRLHWAGGLPEPLADAIRELPRRDQEMLRLHYFEGLTDREIAARLGMEKRDTVRQARNRVEQRVKQICAGGGGHSGTAGGVRGMLEKLRRKLSLFGGAGGLSIG